MGLDNIGIVIPTVEYNTSRLFLADLTRILCSLSKHVYIVGGNADSRSPDRVDVHSIRHAKGTNAFTRVLSYVYLQARISYRLAKLRGTVDLWVFFLGGEALLIPMLVARLSGRRAVLALGGSLEKAGVAQNDMLYRPMGLLKKLTLALSGRIILYSSNLIEEWDLAKHRDKISIAPRHFIDFDSFEIQTPLDDRPELVGYIGRLSREKGILNLLEAIPLVLETREETRYLVGGDGQLRGEVEEHVDHLEDKLRFAGWIPHDELPGYLNELKLLVLPSYTEGLPNIMLEAMACGTPVLATPVGGIPDVIKDGETGFIMEDNSPECIAESIVRALAHPDLEQITENARALVEREFTFEKAVERYRDILRSVSA